MINAYRSILVAGTLLAALSPALAQPAPKATAAPKAAPAPAAPATSPTDVPGGDLFGFSSGTDVGDPGGKSIAFETTTRVGKPGGGTFIMPTLKTQFAYTPMENLQVAFSPFLTGAKINDVPDVKNRSNLQFDGVSGEASYRFITRTEAQPIALTGSIEARLGRVDGATGQRNNGEALTFKLFADRALVPEKLYATANLNVTTSRSRSTPSGENPWTKGSGTDASVALAYQYTDTLFFGGETHWLEAFSGGAGNTWQGRAFTVGPTAFMKVSETVTVNAGWQAQIAGHGRGTGKPLDITNFDRHQFRLKLAASL